jgi:hypothetical protein
MKIFLLFLPVMSHSVWRLLPVMTSDLTATLKILIVKHCGNSCKISVFFYIPQRESVRTYAHTRTHAHTQTTSDTYGQHCRSKNILKACWVQIFIQVCETTSLSHNLVRVLTNKAVLSKNHSSVVFMKNKIVIKRILNLNKNTKVSHNYGDLKP